MTRYRWSVTVPPGTAQTNAVTDTIEIDELELVDGFIFAPPGTAGTIRAELLWGGKVLLPSPDSDRTVLPGNTDPAPVDFTVPGSPYELTLRAWAPHSTVEHTVTARVDAVEATESVQDVRIVATGRPAQNRRQPPTAEDITPEGEDG